MATTRVAAKDLKVGDNVRWNGVDGVIEGRVHDIEEKGDGVRTIRLEPVGSCARMLNADERVEVVLS